MFLVHGYGLLDSDGPLGKRFMSRKPWVYELVATIGTSMHARSAAAFHGIARTATGYGKLASSLQTPANSV